MVYSWSIKITLNEEVSINSINLRDHPHLGSFCEEGYLKACTAHNMAVNFKFKMVFNVVFNKIHFYSSYYIDHVVIIAPKWKPQ